MRTVTSQVEWTIDDLWKEIIRIEDKYMITTMRSLQDIPDLRLEMHPADWQECLRNHNVRYDNKTVFHDTSLFSMLIDVTAKTFMGIPVDIDPLYNEGHPRLHCDWYLA